MKDRTPTPKQICQMCHWSSECPKCCANCKKRCNAAQNCGLNTKATAQASRWTVWQQLMLRAIIIILSISSISATPPTIVAQTLSVTDGDTLKVRAGSRTLKVRLWGIDAPEAGQQYGTSATLELRRLAGATTFTLQVKSTDRYSRLVAILTLPDGRQVNRLMLDRGAAWWYRQYAPKASDLMFAQDAARADRRGLWREPNPTPPWTYRAAQRARAPLPARHLTPPLAHAL